jgi:hypothetical protein
MREVSLPSGGLSERQAPTWVCVFIRSINDISSARVAWNDAAPAVPRLQECIRAENDHASDVSRTDGHVDPK